MKPIFRNVVKIQTPTDIGTGLVFWPSIDSTKYYIFTAKHCILGVDFNEKHANSEIRVTFLGIEGEDINYQLTDEDILIKDEIQSHDLSIIIVEKESIEKLFSHDYFSFFIAIPTHLNIGSKCFISGYPNSIGNDYIRTLENCQLTTDSDFQYQFQIISNDSVVNQYSSEKLVRGYSGGIVFIEESETIYVLGILTDFEKTNKRFHAVNFALANTLLEKNGFTQIPLLEIETDEKILGDIRLLKEKTNWLLNTRIKSTIRGKYLDRRILLDKLIETIIADSLIVVYGKAGVGKSAIVKGALADLNDNYEVLALQAQELDKSNIDKVFKESLGIKSDRNRLFDSKKLKKNKIILIDSIEKLIESKNAETIIDFIDLLRRKDIKLILTCRSYAVERFKLIFLNYFTNISLFEIDELQDDDLKKIFNDYPHIELFYQKVTFKKILSNPFFLNMATLLLLDTHSNVVIDSEIEFKRRIWFHLIEKNNPKRGEIVIEIALKKAKSMGIFAKLEGTDNNLIQELVSDEIIETDNHNLKRLTPAHDIYEDLALSRYIEDKYQEWSANNSMVGYFFQSIGNERAIRRVFRIWISESLQQVDYNLKEFIAKILQEPTLESFWKDETLIAILQSSYSESFLSSKKEWLIKNDAHLFKKCLSLSISSCQVPNFSFINNLETNQRTQIYETEYLVPIGQGWEIMVNFVYNNYKEVSKYNTLIVDFILQWRKKVKNFEKLPNESKQVGTILLNILGENKEYSEESFSFYKIELSLITLFKLTEVLKPEIEQFIETTLRELHDKENWRNRKFNEKIIEIVLSWGFSNELCKNIPELICKVATKQWFYFPKEEVIQDPFHWAHRDNFWDNSTTFGINFHHGYSPASAYQTFLPRLLTYHPFIALDFIIKLTNHAITTYLNHPKKELIPVTIILDENLLNTQWGNEDLWCIYRGTSRIMPNLYQCLMMALESWLFDIIQLCKHTEEHVSNTYTRLLKLVFRRLLGESKSVTTTSILVSVSVAHPEICAEFVIPILKVKEFYNWDLLRYTHDLSKPILFNDTPKYILNERIDSNKLPHRKEHLEGLVLKLSLSEYRATIFDILDTFYTNHSNDYLWKLALNRMDLRKQEVIMHKENYFALKPKLDEDVKKFIEPANKQIEEDKPFLGASNWINQKYDNSTNIDISFESWLYYYKLYENADTSIFIFSQPGKLAAIGIRDYFEELSESLQNWCVNQIFKIIDNQIEQSKKEFDLSNSLTHNIMDVKPCFEILSELVHKCDGNFQRESKTKLFLLIIHLHQENNLHFEILCKKIGSYLWTYAPKFSFALFVSLVEYAKIAEEKYKFNSNSTLYEFNNKKREKIRQNYISKTDRIISKLLEDNVKISIDAIDFKKYDIWTLGKIISILSSSVVHEKIQSFIINFLSYLMEELEHENDYRVHPKLPHQLIPDFQIYLGDFILAQPNNFSVKIIQTLVDWLYLSTTKKSLFNDGRFDFSKQCLKQIIYSVDSNNTLKSNFILLWHYLFEKIKNADKKYYSNLILLSIDWKEDAMEWKPIEGQKDFFEKVINALQSIEPTAKLLSGIGFKELMPDGINWYANMIRQKPIGEQSAYLYTEKLIKRVFYNTDLRRTIKRSLTLRGNFIYILDLLIENNSTIAFLIRDEFISKSH